MTSKSADSGDAGLLADSGSGGAAAWGEADRVVLDRGDQPVVASAPQERGDDRVGCLQHDGDALQPLAGM